VEEREKVEILTLMEAAQLLFMASIPGFAERKSCLCTFYAILTSSLFLQPLKGCQLSLQQIEEGKVLKIRYSLGNYLV
jgi:hypothetical protein